MKKKPLRSLLAILCVAVLLVGLLPAVMAAEPALKISAAQPWPNTALAAGKYSDTAVTYSIYNNTGDTITGLTAELKNNNGFEISSGIASSVASGQTVNCTVKFPAGKSASASPYTATLVVSGVSGGNGVSALADCSVTVGKDYDMNVAVSGADWTNADLVDGKYAAQTVTYKVTNTGVNALTGVKAVLGNQSASGCFFVNGSNTSADLGTINAGGSASFTVVFPVGLHADTYSAHVTVSANEAVSDKIVNLSMQVKGGLSVKFYNGTTLLYTDHVANGGKAVFSGSTPAKANAGGGYTYRFAGWTDNSAAASANVCGQGGVTANVDLNTYAFTEEKVLYAVFTQHYGISENVSGECSGSGADVSQIYNESYNSIYYQLSQIVMKDLGTAPAYVKFGAETGTTFGKLYTNNTATSLVGTSTKYYFSQSGYGDKPLANVFFKPTGKSGVYSVEYTAYDASGSSVYGTILISAGGVGDVSYTVSHKSTVTLSASDFTTHFNKYRGTYTLNYVSFGNPSVTPGDTYGRFYYNYGATGQFAFTNASLSAQNFYVSNSAYGSYPISSLTFVPGTTTADYTVSVPFYAFYNGSVYVSGTLTIEVTDGHTIEYSVAHDESVAFKGADFSSALKNKYPSANLSYVYFGVPDRQMNSLYGGLYYDYKGTYETALTTTNLQIIPFQYGTGSYLLDKLSFVPGTYANDYTVTIPYTAYADAYTYVEGSVVVTVKDDGAVSYTVAHNGTVTLKSTDFAKCFNATYKDKTFGCVKFGAPNLALGSANGNFYYNYKAGNQNALSSATLQSGTYYAGTPTGTSSTYIDLLTFVPGTNRNDYTLKVPFTAYGTSASYQVTGIMTIKVTNNGITSCDIVYNTRSATPVSICPADIEALFKENYPGTALSYITIGAVPESGTLYYNYGGTGKYGSTTAVKLTDANVSNYRFDKAPASTSAFSMYDLSYVPGSSSNYCVEIPFTAYASAAKYVSGNIVISVTSGTYNDVYMATVKNTSAAVNATNFYNAVKTATNGTLSYVQFLKLPDAKKGTLYYNYKANVTGNEAVDTSDKLYYSSGSALLSKVSFVPYTGFTGNVEIPFAAYGANDTLLCVGVLSVGVVNKIAVYSDVTATSWYYKYIVELSDAGVINGYPNGTFKPSGNVTYGEALKLILVAAGYGEQARVSAKEHWASGYLNKAIALGIYSSSEAKSIKLDSAITRQEVARLAAAALRLPASSISSPFTDTTNASVLALYQAGIIEGSFNSAGQRLFRPSSSITRAEVSAIVWRINNYA